MNHFIELLWFVSFAVFRSHFFSSDTVGSFTSVSPSVLLFEIFFFNSSKEFFISSSKPNARAISIQPSSALPLTVVLRKSQKLTTNLVEYVGFICWIVEFEIPNTFSIYQNSFTFFTNKIW